MDADHDKNSPHRIQSISPSAAHVPFDFFDREGVQQLERSLTSQSQALIQVVDRANAGRAASPAPSNSSQITAAVGNDSLNLEKYARSVISRCVVAFMRKWVALY
jgi:hypothetical protein